MDVINILLAFDLIIGSGLGSENAAAKIIEFSKKIRELTAELEKEKSKALNYKKKYQELELVSNLNVKKVLQTDNEKMGMLNYFDCHWFYFKKCSLKPLILILVEICFILIRPLGRL